MSTDEDYDVVVVAARDAWPEYEKFHAYVCQRNRRLPAKRMAFYSKNNIYPLVPTILHSYEDIEMKRNVYEGELGRLANRLLEAGPRTEGKRYKVVFLSAPDSLETIKLPRAIPNDKKSHSGKGTAFTMGQRYVSLEALLAAKTTSDLE